MRAITLIFFAFVTLFLGTMALGSLVPAGIALSTIVGMQDSTPLLRALAFAIIIMTLAGTLIFVAGAVILGSREDRGTH